MTEHKTKAEAKPVRGKAGATKHETPDEAHERQEQAAEKDLPKQRSLKENRERRDEVMAENARPGDKSLHDRELDREGPVCIVEGCEIQQLEGDRGFCPNHWDMIPLEIRNELNQNSGDKQRDQAQVRALSHIRTHGQI